MAEDSMEIYEEYPGILSRTRWWDPEKPTMETVRAARSREDEIAEANRCKVKCAGKQ